MRLAPTWPKPHAPMCVFRCHTYHTRASWQPTVPSECTPLSVRLALLHLILEKDPKLASLMQPALNSACSRTWYGRAHVLRRLVMSQ